MSIRLGASGSVGTECGQADPIPEGETMSEHTVAWRTDAKALLRLDTRIGESLPSWSVHPQSMTLEDCAALAAHAMELRRTLGEARDAARLAPQDEKHEGTR